MTQLFERADRPNQLAVSRTGTPPADGAAFFLDFTRPLEPVRRFTALNRQVGPLIGFLVPVLHEWEQEGGFVINVDRSDPCYSLVQGLWKERYPSKPILPTGEWDGTKIVGDFARQFPENCQLPPPPDEVEGVIGVPHLIFVALHVGALLFFPMALFLTIPLHLIYAAIRKGQRRAAVAQKHPSIT